MLLNFSGIGCEMGQMHRGLAASCVKASEYFSILENAGIDVVHRGVLMQERYSRMKFFNESDIKKMKWDFFENVFEKTLGLLSEESLLLNWGGDHSVTLSTVSAFVNQFSEGYVIWIDAHADLNLPSYSLTGNLHGMPLSLLLNLNDIGRYNFKWMKTFLKPEKLVYLGLRDLDPFEQETIDKLGISAFTRKQIRQMGIDAVIDEILGKIGDAPVHISFDIDSVDPRLAPSTGVPVGDGLSDEELQKLAMRFRSSLDIRSVDMVEINPSIGNTLQVDQTFITAMHFLKNLFAHPGGFDESMGERIEAKYSSQMERSFSVSTENTTPP